jgi:hypothetical protein
MSDIAIAAPAAAPVDLLPGLPDVATSKQLSEVTQIPEASLAQDRYLRQGIPFCRIGSRIRYLKVDVLRFLAANRAAQAAEADEQLALFDEPARQEKKLVPLGGKDIRRD